jgi:hypothetical protein
LDEGQQLGIRPIVRENDRSENARVRPILVNGSFNVGEGTDDAGTLCADPRQWAAMPDRGEACGKRVAPLSWQIDQRPRREHDGHAINFERVDDFSHGIDSS